MPTKKEYGGQDKDQHRSIARGKKSKAGKKKKK